MQYLKKAAHFVQPRAKEVVNPALSLHRIIRVANVYNLDITGMSLSLFQNDLKIHIFYFATYSVA